MSAALLRSASESMGFLRGSGRHCYCTAQALTMKRGRDAIQPLGRVTRLKPVRGGFALVFTVGQRRELSHPLADFLAGKAKFIQRLQAEPELRGGSEPMAEPQRGVCRYATLSVNDRR